MSFFGDIQGPWYTVGYKMAVMVERRFGRPVLIQCMLDRRLLLVRYDQAAEELNKRSKEKLSLWSTELLDLVHAPHRATDSESATAAASFSNVPAPES